MKILSSQQIRDVDVKTLEYRNISSIELMHMASDAIYWWLINKHMVYGVPIAIFCGTGNNGGDGISLATMLHQIGAKVSVYIVEYNQNYSSDFTYYHHKAIETGVPITTITNIDQVLSLDDTKIIVDAIFGTGLNRKIEGIAYEVIKKINESNVFTIIIDIPSGLMMNKATNFAVKASETVSLQIPKLALFLPDNFAFVGDVTILDFGLSQRAINETATNQYYITKKDIRDIIKPLYKFSHKGTQGHSLIIGGSIGKIGSVCLASKAALKSGCGLVTAFVPKCGTIPLQSNFAEAMVIEDTNQTIISDIDNEIVPDAIGIGVGMGKNDITKKALLRFLKSNNKPMVIDADAINIIADHKEYFDYLHPKTILTPHPKELSRLIGEWNDDFEKIEMTSNLAKHHNLIIVIKGAHSIIVSPNEIYVNSSGTPALATAGSGDVLTGIIVSLLAQGYEPLQATKIGVYLHGSTANITSSDIHPLSFVASNIIENIGKAYYEIGNNSDDIEIEYYKYD